LGKIILGFASFVLRIISWEALLRISSISGREKAGHLFERTTYIGEKE